MDRYAETPAGAASGRSRRSWAGWAAILALGLVLRVWLALFADVPRFEIDHLHLVAWERIILEKGLFAVYADDSGYGDYVVTQTSSEPPSAEQEGDGRSRRVLVARDSGPLPDFMLVVRPNYPPACMVVVAAAALLHRALDPTLAPRTLAARCALFVPTAFFDLVLAVACSAVVLASRGTPRQARYAFAWLWCGPTFWVDFALLGQIDSWACAWAALAWLALLRGKYGWAGALTSVAALTKVQSLVALLPGLLALSGSLPEHPTVRASDGGGLPRDPRIRYALGLVGSACLVLAPFQWIGGGRWFDLSVSLNLWRHPTSNMGSWFAANVWMLFQMLSDTSDATTHVLGLSWHTWGVLLFMGLILPAGLGWWRRYRFDSRGWPVLTAMLVIVGFFCLTRMTDRYLLFAVPFVAVAAAVDAGTWLRRLNVWLNLIVGAHLARTFWWAGPNAGLEASLAPASRILSVLLFALVAAGTLYTVVSVSRPCATAVAREGTPA